MIAVLLAMVNGTYAQEGVVTFGFQFKPLVPNRFLGFEPIEASHDSLTATWTPRVSMNFGMVIRYGINNSISLETGINLVRRNYTTEIFSDDTPEVGEIRHAFIGYEIPIQGLFYVKLGDKLWMNASGGISVDFYPSNTFSTSSVRVDSIVYDFEQYTGRRSWAQIAVQANYGFEYRTKKSGYFYLGASFHRPFSSMAFSEALMIWPGHRRRVVTELTGTYFTFDLRYFFHEDPERRR